MIVTDIAGKPLRVIMDYQDYTSMAEELGLPLTTSTITEGYIPQKWETLAESGQTVLAGLIYKGSIIYQKEQDRANPDRQWLAELAAIRDEARELCGQDANVVGQQRMVEMVDKYCHVLWPGQWGADTHYM